MIRKIIFLLEEPSMKAFLVGFLPRQFPDWIEGVHFQCIAHEGKSDLDRSIPRKLRAWKEPGVQFVVLRDNDGGDCYAQKSRLVRICVEAGRPRTLVRLVCQELEAWYLGDASALALAFPEARLKPLKISNRFLDPDGVGKPSVEVERLIPGFQKGSGARSMGRTLSTQNSSHSFQVFLTGIHRLAAEFEA